MPAANLAGGLLCYIVGRRFAWVGAALFAIVIASAVSLMLSVIIKAPFTALFPGLLVSEAILIVGGVPIMKAILRIAQPLRRRWSGD
jgi:hypothetical protein